MYTIVGYLLIGFGAGIFGGLLGLGGGVVVVVALVYLLGFSQHLAQGTSLAMLIPPIGILAVWTYYKQGYVDVRVAGFLCLGFILGGLLGAKVAVGLPREILSKVFGVALLVIAVKMILGK
jgi:uncharacterized membrane protein YfcA